MEDFVPFEIAKKLKEKGFTLPKSNVVGKFDSDGVFHSQLYINFTETMDSEEIIAPTISQVLDWLRKEKKLHIRMSVYSIGWCVDVTNMDGKRMHGTECEYHNYRQAALAGIKYIIDINLI